MAHYTATLPGFTEKLALPDFSMTGINKTPIRASVGGMAVQKSYETCC